MSVSSLGATSNLTALTGVDPTTTASSTSAVTSADTSQLSEFAKLLKQLADLQKSDPEKFKEVTAAIAQQLQAAASTATGPQADFLKDLAGKFDQASKTGDLSAVQSAAPSEASQGHHHHHVHKYAAQSSSAAASSQKVDLAQIIQSALDNAG